MKMDWIELNWIFFHFWIWLCWSKRMSMTLRWGCLSVNDALSDKVSGKTAGTSEWKITSLLKTRKKTISTMPLKFKIHHGINDSSSQDRQGQNAQRKEIFSTVQYHSSRGIFIDGFVFRVELGKSVVSTGNALLVTRRPFIHTDKVSSLNLRVSVTAGCGGIRLQSIHNVSGGPRYGGASRERGPVQGIVVPVQAAHLNRRLEP